jgi:hypothetical protein
MKLSPISEVKTLGVRCSKLEVRQRELCDVSRSYPAKIRNPGSGIGEIFIRLAPFRPEATEPPVNHLFFLQHYPLGHLHYVSS